MAFAAAIAGHFFSFLPKKNLILNNLKNKLFISAYLHGKDSRSGVFAHSVLCAIVSFAAVARFRRIFARSIAHSGYP